MLRAMPNAPATELHCSHGRCRRPLPPGSSNLTCDHCRARERMRTLARWLGRAPCPRCGKPDKRVWMDVCDACAQAEFAELRTKDSERVDEKGTTWRRNAKTGRMQPVGKGKF